MTGVCYIFSPFVLVAVEQWAKLAVSYSLAADGIIEIDLAEIYCLKYIIITAVRVLNLNESTDNSVQDAAAEQKFAVQSIQ